MKKFSAEEACALVDEAILIKKEKELDDVFTIIKEACREGKYIAYLEKICYQETVDTLEKLGYTVIVTKKNSYKEKWCCYTISWVK